MKTESNYTTRWNNKHQEGENDTVENGTHLTFLSSYGMMCRRLMTQKDVKRVEYHFFLFDNDEITERMFVDIFHLYKMWGGGIEFITVDVRVQLSNHILRVWIKYAISLINHLKLTVKRNSKLITRHPSDNKLSITISLLNDEWFCYFLKKSFLPHKSLIQITQLEEMSILMDSFPVHFFQCWQNIDKLFLAKLICRWCP